MKIRSPTPFSLGSEIREMTINEDDILVFYDVSSLLTNVPLDETIEILAENAFTNNFFNKTHNLEVSTSDLVRFLRVKSRKIYSSSLTENYMNRLTV